MRLIPYFVVGLLAASARAQVSEDIVHPPVIGPNVFAMIRTARESTRFDAQAFAVSDFQHGQFPQLAYYFEFQTMVRAVGAGNQSEATLEAEIVAAEPIFVRWQMIGPGQFDLTGPIVDIHQVSLTSAMNPKLPLETCPPFFHDFQNMNCPGLYLQPGTYNLTLTQSLSSGQYPDTASIQAFVFVTPEPETWSLACGIFLAVAMNRQLGSCFRRCRSSL